MDQKKPFKQPVKPEKTVYNSTEDEKRAYDILLKRHLNDDRLMMVRTAILLIANVLLFLGFISLINIDSTNLLRITVAAVGIFLCLLSSIGGIRNSKSIDFWMKHEIEIEKNGRSFVYMRRYGSTPHLVYKYIGKNRVGLLLQRLSLRCIYAILFPLSIFVLWVVSLVWIIIN